MSLKFPKMRFWSFRPSALPRSVSQLALFCIFGVHEVVFPALFSTSTPTFAPLETGNLSNNSSNFFANKFFFSLFHRSEPREVGDPANNYL